MKNKSSLPLFQVRARGNGAVLRSLRATCMEAAAKAYGMELISTFQGVGTINVPGGVVFGRKMDPLEIIQKG